MVSQVTFRSGRLSGVDPLTSYHGAAALGALGGLLVELAFTSRFINTYRRVPWSRKGKPATVRTGDGKVSVFETLGTYIFAVVVRMLLGAGVSAVLLLSGPLSLFSAAVGGMAAYALVDQYASGAELPDNRAAESGSST